MNPNTASRLLLFTVGLLTTTTFSAPVSGQGTFENVNLARSKKPVFWVSSTEQEKWRQMPSPLLQPDLKDAPPEIRVAPDVKYQTIDGFGGCFNELGWVALSKTSETERKQVLTALFGNQGSDFMLARLPMGASDFALDGYSLDDTPGDTALKHFSIERDRKQLLPFVKAAMAVRPSLQCWGSPWSPPAWMKTNNSYSRGALKWEPAILRAYANYFTRWIDDYRKEGVNIYAVTPQNEPNIDSPYPSCLWTGAQLREFIGAYLGPTLRQKQPKVQLWLGLNGDPINNGDNPNARLIPVLEDRKSNDFLTGIGFQYDSRNQTALAHELYPAKKLMQSETVCFNGDNSWRQAQELYGLMKRYFDGGANAYFAWNMVLNETGLSTWNWKQNALVTVEQNTGKVTYNGEYYVMRHFSQFVKPGAKRVLTTGVWGDKIAFVNPDGSTVMVIGNSSNQPQNVSLVVAGRTGGDTLKVTLAPQSLNTFVLPRQ